MFFILFFKNFIVLNNSCKGVDFYIMYKIYNCVFYFDFNYLKIYYIIIIYLL